MDNQLRFKRLQDTIDKLKELRPDQFKYDSFVSKSEGENCGTVCCAAGWYPKWFPEAGLRWKKRHMDDSLHLNFGTDGIKKILSKWHGICTEEVEHLFFGESVTIDGVLCYIPDGLNADLPTVIEVFENFLKLM